jgi:hypothetical protein
LVGIAVIAVSLEAPWIALTLLSAGLWLILHLAN